jgi:hypothetical protein
MHMLRYARSENRGGNRLPYGRGSVRALLNRERNVSDRSKLLVRHRVDDIVHTHPNRQA